MPSTASTSRRCPSAYSVSNASVDLPLPDTPVTTVNAPRGMSTVTPRRLCSRAPMMRIAPRPDFILPGDAVLGLGVVGRTRHLHLVQDQRHSRAGALEHRPAQEKMVVLQLF